MPSPGIPAQSATGEYFLYRHLLRFPWRQSAPGNHLQPNNGWVRGMNFVDDMKLAINHAELILRINQD